MSWNDLLLRLRALAFRKRVERELDEELQFHLEMERRKNAAAGVSDTEAAGLARVQFGGVEQAKEECRDARGLFWIDTILQDVRYALRGFRRTPAFALTVVATIALGLGLNTTLFTIFNAYVLRPVAVRDPYSLYSFYWINKAGEGARLTWREFEDFRKQNSAFSEVMGHHFLFARVEGHPLEGQFVTGNYFRMLGVLPALGRTLLPGDDAAPGSEPVIVLSYAAWQRKFGGEAEIVGKKLIIHGYPLTVVGIAKEGFSGLGDTPHDFWAPMSMAGQVEDGPSLFGPEQPRRIDIVGRLKPELSARQATAALTTWARQMTANRPESERATGADLQSQATAVPLTAEVLLFFSPIMAAFGLVLLIACANVAGMMLARAMARQREIGIRLSLGASRPRLIRQLLTEGVLLALPAAAAGFALSQATIQYGERLMFATMPADFAEFITVIPLPPDARVFGFMLAASVVSAVLFGLAPAIQATRTNVMQAARGDFSSDFRPARLRNALVAGQITMCALLLICAGVLLRGARRLANFDVGLKTTGVVEIEIQDKFRARILERLASEPLVQTVAAAQSPPLDGTLPTVPVVAGEGANAVGAWYNLVSPEYFPVLQVPILRGRNFTRDEAAAGAPVAIISLATARLFWGNREAVGQSIHMVRDPRHPAQSRVLRHESVRVIGVARDVVSCCAIQGLDKTCIYLPTTPAEGGDALLVRVHGDGELARRKLDAELATINPGAIDQIHLMGQMRAAGVYPFQAASWVCGGIGALALLLTLSGIYGVLSYLVTQRTKEIGIRVALGASTESVTFLVLRQSMRLAGFGIALGSVLALGVSRIFASVFVTMNMFDGPAYGAGVLLVIAASAAAAYFPSRRAARIDPITTLRYD